MAKELDILTTFEAAKVCHVSYNTIKNWIKRGLLGAYRTAGGHIRIKAADLEVFCREHSIPMDKEALPQPRKVLIVDDEESVRVGLTEVLKQHTEKFDIFSAADGFEAGLKMEKIRPDLVILDIIMPGMDGFKVCQSITRSPTLKHAKIIVLTGYPSEANIEKAKELGAHLCMAKPVDKAKLFDAIAGILEPRRGVRGRRRKLSDKK